MTYHPVQVSEREPDGSWEDCTWASGVMLANAAYAATKYPPNQAEYEALRKASGDLVGGSTIDDLQRGMDARYGWHGKITSDALFAITALRVGESCALQGNMGRATDHLRRWDPGFRAGHCVHVVRDATGYWWQNPQAPQTYQGEYVLLSDIQRYAGGLPGAKAMTVIVGSRQPSEPHYHATVIHPTELWNDTTHRWVFKTRPIKAGTVLTVRGKQFQKGGVACYPCAGTPWGPPYFVPVSNVGKLVKV